MTTADVELPESLQLERVGDGAYRVPAAPDEAERDVVTGVHLMAWSMAASALEGVGEHSVKTAHGIFMRPAARTLPIDFAVDRFYAGRAFGADTTTVTQGGKNMARVQLLLNIDEPDLIRHSDDMPSVPGPDDCDPFPAGAAGGDVEMRVVGGVDYVSNDHPVRPPLLQLWVRAANPVEGRIANQALLCACTGTMLIGTAMLPHAGIGQEQAHRQISTGVVGHTASYHEPFRLDDWLLLDQESIHAGNGRTHGRARVFDRDGRLVASYVQDAMIRGFTDGRDHSAQSRTIM
jgi:acyl-CoA thioesterase II